MYLRELQFVFIFAIEDNAELVNEAHHGRLPSGTPDEVQDDVKEPFLCITFALLHPLTPHILEMYFLYFEQQHSYLNFNYNWQ